MKRLVLMIVPALICGVVFTSFGTNKTIPKEEKFGDMYEKSEWWQPILEKFNLKLRAYNYYDNVFERRMDVFEMGIDGNSINNGICTLKRATVLIRNRHNNTYALFEADSIKHNIREGVIEFMPIAKKHYLIDSGLRETSATHMNVISFDLTKTKSKCD